VLKINRPLKIQMEDGIHPVRYQNGWKNSQELNRMLPQVRKPIFILGSPRSGTGIFYRTMAQHPDLAWISNITKKMPASLLLTRILMLFRNDHRPTEANKIWSRFVSGDHESVSRDDVTPAARRFLHRVVGNNLRIFDKPRFLSKCPGNTVRIEFLHEIFPDAYFIHVVRDGRAVAYSIMRAREKHSGEYWSTRPPGWRKLQQLPVLEACALQWKMIVEHALESAQNIPADQFIEVKYEYFMQHPSALMQHLGERLGLAWREEFIASLAAGLENRNYKWRQNLSTPQQEKLTALIGDLLERLGYDSGI